MKSIITSILTASLMCAANDGVVTEEQAEISPMIGIWAHVITLGRAGPTHIQTITVNEDGTYHSVDVEIHPGTTNPDDPTSYAPNGASMEHKKGWIDLKTGMERITEKDRKLSVVSVTWSVKDGVLHVDKDLGNMGGDGVTFQRVH